MDQPSVKILSVYTAVVDLIFIFRNSPVSRQFFCVCISKYSFSFLFLNWTQLNCKIVLLITLISVSWSWWFQCVPKYMVSLHEHAHNHTHICTFVYVLFLLFFNVCNGHFYTFSTLAKYPIIMGSMYDMLLLSVGGCAAKTVIGVLCLALSPRSILNEGVTCGLYPHFPNTHHFSVPCPPPLMLSDLLG